MTMFPKFVAPAFRSTAGFFKPVGQTVLPVAREAGAFTAGAVPIVLGAAAVVIIADMAARTSYSISSRIRNGRNNHHDSTLRTFQFGRPWSEQPKAGDVIVDEETGATLTVLHVSKEPVVPAAEASPSVPANAEPSATVAEPT
jgi:hypothetical protein